MGDKICPFTMQDKWKVCCEKRCAIWDVHSRGCSIKLIYELLRDLKLTEEEKIRKQVDFPINTGDLMDYGTN